MAERWQQWMPHDIDAWQGSANVQALSDLAYRAVHNLLQDMWKQEDCALPDDERELSKRSRVAARWLECRDEVFDYFKTRNADGKLTNLRLLKEWTRARKVNSRKPVKTDEEISRERSTAGAAGAKARWQKWQTDSKNVANDGTNTTPQGQVQKTKPTRVEAASVVLPEWVDAEVWEGYLDVRRKKRAVLTERALMAVLKQLAQFRARGHDPNAVLETSMRSNWTDVYEPKGVGNGTNQVNHVRGQQRVDQAIDELRKAGVEIPDRRAEESAGEVRATTWGSDGRDPPGVVLEGSG